jgi:adenylate cyclase
MPVVAVILIASRRTGAGLLLATCLVGLWIAFATFAFVRGTWFSMALPLASALPTAIAFTSGRLLLEQRIERRLTAREELFRRFQPPALADHLSLVPDFLEKPVQQMAAVLFIDLNGFTGLSEQLGPAASRELLGDFHALIEDEVTRHGGSVIDYMGDGAMIIFGLPMARSDDPCHAIDAALDLARAILHWIDGLPGRRDRLGVKIGAHYGPVVVSRLGAKTHQQIAATGDCVNVASRLCALAATHHALVAVSGDLFETAARHDHDGWGAASSFTEERQIAIRGRRQPVGVRFWGNLS